MTTAQDSPAPDSIKARDAVKLRMMLGFGSLFLLSLLLAFGMFSASQTAAQREEAERWHVHTLDVLIVTGELETAINAAIRGERGYLLTGKPLFLDPYLEGRAAASKLVPRLAAMTRDNPRQQRNVARLSADVDRYLATLDDTVRLQKQGKGPEALDIVRKGIGRERIEAALQSLRAVEAEEHRLLETRHRAHAQHQRRGLVFDRIIIGSGAFLVLIVIAVGAAAARASRRAQSAVSELRRLATTDVLTGLVNRRHFFNLLEAEVARSGRSGRPLSLAVLDVDHFKRINDENGHPAGDAVLRKVADALRGATRSGDVLARIGGEEFAVLMPDADEGHAAIACERLRRAVERAEFELENGRRLAVTLSSGVALLVERESPERLMSRADGALYEAKVGGRNQVRMAA